MELELRAVAFDDPDAVDLIAAARAEIDARDAVADPSAAGPRGPITERTATDSDLVVAYAGGQPVGVAALRRFDTGIGEIKRMYVVPRTSRRRTGSTSPRGTGGFRTTTRTRARIAGSRSSSPELT
jgi:hypothetical protein